MNIINKLLRKKGYILKPYPDNELLRRKKVISNFNINKIIDVGASTGEYALCMRRLGFNGEIFSFEPLTRSFEKLRKKAQRDNLWQIFNHALGNENQERIINISENYDSSSMLEINDIHTRTEERSKTISKESIEVKTLDSIFEDYFKELDNIYLKIDTQGFEDRVLQGANNSLKKIKAIQIEMSIVPLYNNSLNYIETIDLLRRYDFSLYGVEPGFYNKKTGQLLQFDGIFIREE